MYEIKAHIEVNGTDTITQREKYFQHDLTACVVVLIFCRKNRLCFAVIFAILTLYLHCGPLILSYLAKALINLM